MLCSTVFPSATSHVLLICIGQGKYLRDISSLNYHIFKWLSSLEHSDEREQCKPTRYLCEKPLNCEQTTSNVKQREKVGDMSKEIKAEEERGHVA